jgi:Tfp pilus assembly protein PilX
MMRPSARTDERGMVLLIALFTLVLLSVIGLGLMYSTNMETFINANYRDKQVAMYGASTAFRKRATGFNPQRQR